MQAPRTILETIDKPVQFKLALLDTFDKIMDVVWVEGRDLTEHQRTAVGVIVAEAIAAIATAGQSDTNEIYLYGLSQASAAFKVLRARK